MSSLPYDGMLNFTCTFTGLWNLGAWRQDKSWITRAKCKLYWNGKGCLGSNEWTGLVWSTWWPVINNTYSGRRGTEMPGSSTGKQPVTSARKPSDFSRQFHNCWSVPQSLLVCKLTVQSTCSRNWVTRGTWYRKFCIICM